jgi:hypothetical protein
MVTMAIDVRRRWSRGYDPVQYSAKQPGLRIARAVQTCSGMPAQWDAWTDTGQYLYLRYRWGNGSVTPYPSADYETWDVNAQPIIEWDDGTDSSWIDLDDFLAAAGIDRVQARPGWWQRLTAWLRRLTTRR